MHKGFLLGASVKAVDDGDPRGTFEMIASTEALDRDKEIVDKGAFTPLPESIPAHAYHDFRLPVGRGVPSYEDALMVRGHYSKIPFAQEIRQLVEDEVIQHSSVGFMPPERKMVDDVPHIVRAELLEVSFTTVPSNRETRITASKGLWTPGDGAQKALAGSFEAQTESLLGAIRELLPDVWWTTVIGTFADKVVFEVEGSTGTLTYEVTYEFGEDGAITLSAPTLVVIEEVLRPAGDGEPEKATATDPEQKAAAQAAADSPAEVPVDEAQAVLALLDAFTQGALA